jgi:hypothetical protein
VIGGVGGRTHVCKSCSMCSPATYFASGGMAAMAAVPGMIAPSRSSNASSSSAAGRSDERGSDARRMTAAVGAARGPGSSGPRTGEPSADAARSGEPRASAPGPGARRTGPPGTQLTPEQEREVAALRRRDAEVRAHEAAHKAVAGSLGGAVSYTFQRGPDGALYAIGGEVPITLSEGRTPEETIRRARQVRAAALAPANPSGADRSVASAASALEMKAQREATAAQRERVARAADERAERGAPGAGASEGAPSVGAGASERVVRESVARGVSAYQRLGAEGADRSAGSLSRVA